MARTMQSPTRRGERAPLERRYGAIGISAVAAAARYKDEEPPVKTPKIPARFEEDEQA